MSITEQLRVLVEMAKAQLRADQEARKNFEEFRLSFETKSAMLEDEDKMLYSELRSLSCKRWSIVLRDVADLLEDL